MNLHSGTLFWPTTFSKPTHINPPIKPHYDALIVGGGMSGVLTAKALLDEGLQVALIERNEIGSGSTLANTGLLQYSNDIQLHELADLIGEQDAVTFYKFCYEAVDSIEEIALTLPSHADFIRRPSICFASKKMDVKKLEKECKTLIKHGFPAEYWNGIVTKKRLPFETEAVLFTENDAEINPYKFVVSLTEQLKTRGLDVFEQTIVNIIEDEETHVVVHTIEGVFTAKRMIYTTGYERLPYGRMKGTDVNCSYAIVTEPQTREMDWFENALIWETARPYIYMRKTIDNRIIIGGLDEGNATPSNSESKIDHMGQLLLNRLHELLPGESFEAPYKYCASFGESVDHLPFIGEHPSKPNHFYLLGYGGNGTVYSMLGSKILADLIMNRPNDAARIVTLDRKHGIKE